MTPRRYQNRWQLWTALTTQARFEGSAALTGSHCRRWQRSESAAQDEVSMATTASGGGVGGKKTKSALVVGEISTLV